MTKEIQVLLFGDQSEDVIGELQSLVLLKDNPLLSTFFEQAYLTLRTEVALFPHETQNVAHFTSIETLLSRYSDAGVKNPAIESALVNLYQTANLLRHSGTDFVPYPSPDSTVIVGSCTGLLAAASVSCASSYLQLVPVALETLKLAFRIGVEVAKTCDTLNQNSTGSASWSTIFPGVDKSSARQILNDFYTEKAIPSTSRPYVSATGANSVTISGHPRELDALASSGVLKSSRPVRLPIYGPYHSPTFYSDENVTSILSAVQETASDAWVPKIPIIANEGASQYESSNYAALMEHVIQDILKKPLDWESVCVNCIKAVDVEAPEQCRITAMGSRHGANSLKSAFTNKGVSYTVVLEDAKPQDIPRRSSAGIGKSPIAIVGMSGRYPDAASLEQFWDLLKRGVDTHREIRDDRFNAQTHYDPTGKRKNTSHTPYGCFVEHPGLFDAKFFNMSPKEATQTDPMHRLALLTAYEALEMSGFVPNRTPSSMVDRIGTFYGQTSDDWREIQNGQNIQTYFIPGGVRAFAPGRINYHFGFTGPSFSVDTACSSSLAAINIACNALWLGDCDTALAGGLNILTNPDIFAGLSRGQFLSKTGNCKTFDDEADGYCRGDGAGSVVLKRLEDAEADNDPILAVILGAGTNHSADAVSITHPHAGNQEFLFKKILVESGVDPNEVSYVEMHGTGTQAGDAIEMESVLNSFAPENRPRGPDSPLFLGSVKSNIGHGEAASGITALTKVLLMLDHNTIPPHCGIKTKINRNFPDLAARNVHISRGRETAWNRPVGGKRRFFLNNFSAAGGNSSLIMEDGPLRIIDSAVEDPRPLAVVTVSGKTKPAFVHNVENLIQYLAENPSVDLPSLSYTTTARRSQYQFRTVVSGATIAEIQAGLHKALGEDVSPLKSAKKSVVFTYTGQGSHYITMGKVFYETSAQFKSDIQRFDGLAQSQGFPSILPILQGDEPIESLSPVVVQTGALCIQIALTHLWESLGVTPSAVIGHSLGEYAALYAAGVLSVNDAIFLVATRASILVKTCTMNTHAMLAVSASVQEVESVIDGATYELACVNGPKAVVISGKADKIAQLKEELASKGMKCTVLSLPFAFHSSQVDPALAEFEAAAAAIEYHAPKTPIISPLLSSVVDDQTQISAEYLRRHFRLTVDFNGGLEAAKEVGLINEESVFVEVGSHPICSGMVKSIFGSTTVTAPSMRKGDDAWKTLATSLCTLYTAGVAINWNNYHKDFPRCHNTLHLPTYGWEAVNFWIDYKNDWTLTKGEEVVVPASAPAEKTSLSSSAVHRVVEESFQDSTGKMTTETDISRSDLEEIINGHLVNGSALCSSAVYADMALTIGNYVYGKFKPGETDFIMNCSNMVVEKPLIATGASQMLRIDTTADMSRGTCNLSFYSVNDQGKKTIEHARCQVKFGEPSKFATKMSRQRYLIQSQVDHLLKDSQAGLLSRLPRKMAYKMFSVLVDYQNAYKGMTDVVLDSPNHAGTARVDLQTTASGTFFIPPNQIDSLCHLAGFIMNANDDLDPTKTVYVNHGWESLEFAKKPEPNRTYRSYVRMLPVAPDSKDYSGDVYMFDDEGEIIGQIGGLQFQCMSKQVLDLVLPKNGIPRRASAPVASTKKVQTKTPAKPAKAVAAKAPAAAAAGPAASNVLSRALDIMADEIGVSVSELTDDSELAGFGVDSLMSLTISGKFREELDIDISSALIGDCQTVKDMKKLFEQFDGGSSTSLSSLDESYPSTSDNSGVSTPIFSETGSTTSVSDVEDMPESKEADKLSLVRAIVIEETGISKSELTSSTDLVSLGVDSLMSLQILSALREDHDIDLPSTFFSDHETFGDIEKALGVRRPSSPAASSSTITPRSRIGSTTGVSFATPKVQTTYKASSILLQGNPKTSTQTLFLFPDGSGSPTSYANIPSIAPKDLALIALGCPFMKNADAFDCGIEGVTSIYLEEIRRRQPHGPYLLGGWSAGGICAYEATRQLQAVGEVVEKLIYLDVPCPLPPQALPPRLHLFFDEIGLLGEEGQAPAWLVPHFTATIQALSNYRPGAMDPIKDMIPKTYSVLATDGVCKYDTDPRPTLTPDDPPHMHWLLFNRTDFGSIGWDVLLGGNDNIVPLKPITNVNHFTMMRTDGAKEVANRIREILSA